MQDMPRIATAYDSGKRVSSALGHILSIEGVVSTGKTSAV